MMLLDKKDGFVSSGETIPKLGMGHDFRIFEYSI